MSLVLSITSLEQTYSHNITEILYPFYFHILVYNNKTCTPVCFSSLIQLKFPTFILRCLFLIQVFDFILQWDCYKHSKGIHSHINDFRYVHGSVNTCTLEKLCRCMQSNHYGLLVHVHKL